MALAYVSIDIQRKIKYKNPRCVNHEPHEPEIAFIMQLGESIKKNSQFSTFLCRKSWHLIFSGFAEVCLFFES